MREWRTGGVDEGDIVLVEGDFESRLGHSWVRGRLKQGDYLVAVRHAGDCFFDYLLLHTSAFRRDGENYLSYDPILKAFGAYTLGRVVGRVTPERLDNLKAGITIDVNLSEQDAPKEDA